MYETLFQPCHDKTCLLGFRPSLTQTWLYCHRKWLEAEKIQILEVKGLYRKTKALINCAVVWAFVFAYAKSRVSHETAQLIL